MAIIDDIVNVTINVNAGAEPVASFDTLCICAKLTTTSGKTTPSDVALYGDLAEVYKSWSADDNAYKAAKAAFANGATKVVIAVRKVVESTMEDVEDTLDRAKEFGGWYGFATFDSTDDAPLTIGQWADSNHKMYFFDTTSTTNTCTASRGVGLYVATAGTDHVGWAAKCFSFLAGSEAWAYKYINGGTIQEVNSTTLGTIDTAKLNVFAKVAGSAVTLYGKTCSGAYIDTVRFTDWLTAQIQTEVYNAYAQNAKIRYTDNGIAIIAGAVESALVQGQYNGGIVEAHEENGTWVNGYSVFVPKAADCSATDKSTRTLNNVTFSAELAGAIIKTVIVGKLED